MRLMLATLTVALASLAFTVSASPAPYVTCGPNCGSGGGPPLACSSSLLYYYYQGWECVGPPYRWVWVG